MSDSDLILAINCLLLRSWQSFAKGQMLEDNYIRFLKIMYQIMEQLNEKNS